jgi:hypothetical protein
MIIIVGAGALGSHVALLLRNEDFGIKVVDFDRVEKKNTMSQFHTKMGLGKNKAKALQQSMAGLFDTQIHAIPYKLTDNNVAPLLTGAELVIDCTDNIEARTLIQNFCKSNNYDCLHGALAASGDFSRVMWTEHFAPDAESQEGEATCEDGEHLPFIMATSSWMAVVAQHFLGTNKKKSYQLTPSGVTRLA